jgi:hypothetical protein
MLQIRGAFKYECIYLVVNEQRDFIYRIPLKHSRAWINSVDSDQTAKGEI